MAGVGHTSSLFADQCKERRCESRADLRQVDALQAVAVQGQRGVLARQLRAQPGDVILGTDGVVEPPPPDAGPPTDLAPVHAGRAEFLRLRALPAIATDDAERGNACVAEREDDVSGRDLAHKFVEGIAVTVLVALGRPQIAALNLLAERLILVDPPIAHLSSGRCDLLPKLPQSDPISRCALIRPEVPPIDGAPMR